VTQLCLTIYNFQLSLYATAIAQPSAGNLTFDWIFNENLKPGASLTGLPAACVGQNLTPTAQTCVKTYIPGFVLKWCHTFAIFCFKSGRNNALHILTFTYIYEHFVTAVITVTSLTCIPWLSWFPTDISYLVEIKFSFSVITKRPAGPSRLLLALQPPVGHGLLIHEVSRSHTSTHHSL